MAQTDDKTLLVGQDKAGDEMLTVAFYEGEKRHGIKSKEEGKDVFVPVDMVRIQVPGDQYNVIEREASEFDKRRFSMQYEAYKMQTTGEINGTPLDKLKEFTPDLIKDLHNIGFVTIEQLANASDTVLQKKMGGVRFRTVAIQYLKEASESIDTESKAKIESQANEIAELRAMVEKLADSGNNATRENSPKRRGRKPKES